VGPKNVYGLDDGASRNAGQHMDANSFQALLTIQDSVNLNDTFSSVGKLPSLHSAEGTIRAADGAS